MPDEGEKLYPVTRDLFLIARITSDKAIGCSGANAYSGVNQRVIY